ncbi:MAG: RluA family pseudouridine synthase [Acidobacteria bacterium]|nr:RluA family pseudouridine synthase [Acidobacteriota bacterium]
MIEEQIPPALAGDRLDRVVALLADLSRAQSAALITAGGVAVDGERAATGKVKLEEGQTISIDTSRLPEKEMPRADASVVINVVHADGDVVVVNKQQGLVVHPGAGNPTGTLVHGLLAMYPEIADVGDPMRPGIVHRLDAGTTGLMVVARSPEAYESLVDQLSSRRVHREYVAVAVGHFDAKTGVVDAAIGRDLRELTKMAVRVDGKPARTRYEVVREFSAPIVASLVRCQLETGRTHQIRVHLAAVGHPVLGDATYGGVRSTVPFGRPALHAVRLSFAHPRSGEQLEFEAPLPPDIESLIARLSEGD